MQVLKRGSRGSAVTRLQRKLLELGFDPKGTDGIFGSDTEKALIAFQQSLGLTADGIVEEEILGALGLELEEASHSITASITVETVARMFPASTPLKNIKTYLPFILK